MGYTRIWGPRTAPSWFTDVAQGSATSKGHWLSHSVNLCRQKFSYSAIQTPIMLSFSIHHSLTVCKLPAQPPGIMLYSLL